MRSPLGSFFIALLLTAGFAGCFGNKETDGPVSDAGDDPSKYTDADKFDTAVANQGFQVTGGLTSASTALGDTTSAVKLQVVDNGESDSAGAIDKATLILNAKTTGLDVQASLKTMLTAAQAGIPGGELHAGAAQNIPLDTMLGLPATKAFFIAYGQARVSVNGDLATSLVFVAAAVTYGIRDAQGASMAEQDAHDLEVHVLFPGSLLFPADPVPGVPEGWLYFYFENVAMGRMTPEEKANVGPDLIPYKPPNKPPVPVAKFLLDGKAVSKGLKEGNRSVNVTLDGTGSTDADGTLDAYSWDVFDLARNGSYVPAEVRRASGSSAPYSFTTVGPKLVRLRIIDNAGAIAEKPFDFFVDYHTKLDYPGVATPAGAFADCIEAFNCNVHEFAVEAGVHEGKFIFQNQAEQAPTGVTMELFKPKVAQPSPQAPASCEDDTRQPVVKSTNGTLTASADKFTEYGKWRLCVWYTAGVEAKWEIDTSLDYSPAV